MVHASLFSGIGAADLAAEWMGWENAFSCEVDPFCNQVLAYHFPNTRHYGNIKSTDFTEWRGRVDVLTGGFPCQGFSVAGKRRGTGDDRYLWPEYLRVIREVRPAWVVGENVAGLVTMVEQGCGVTVASGSDMFGEGDCVREARRDRYVLDRIINDLEREGYTVQPFVIPACAVGAPHRRDRIWIIAHGDAADTRGAGLAAEGAQQPAAGVAGDGPQDNHGSGRRDMWRDFPSQPLSCGRDDGLSRRMGDRPLPYGQWRKQAIKAYGNSMVPQVVHEIFRAIQMAENEKEQEDNRS